MNQDEMNEIKDSAICKGCKKPNLIWQDWRISPKGLPAPRFRCGWCGREYSPKIAKLLKRVENEKKPISGIIQD